MDTRDLTVHDIEAATAAAAADYLRAAVLRVPWAPAWPWPLIASEELRMIVPDAGAHRSDASEAGLVMDRRANRSAIVGTAIGNLLEGSCGSHLHTDGGHAVWSPDQSPPWSLCFQPVVTNVTPWLIAGGSGRGPARRPGRAASCGPGGRRAGARGDHRGWRTWGTSDEGDEVFR